MVTVKRKKWQFTKWIYQFENYISAKDFVIETGKEISKLIKKKTISQKGRLLK